MSNIRIPEDSSNIMEWINSDKKYYKNLCKVVKDDGKVLIVGADRLVSQICESFGIDCGYIRTAFGMLAFNNLSNVNRFYEKEMKKCFLKALSKGYRYSIKPYFHVIENSGDNSYYFADSGEVIKYHLIGEQDQDNVYFKTYEEAVMERLKVGKSVIELDFYDNLSV